MIATPGERRPHTPRWSRVASALCAVLLATAQTQDERAACVTEFRPGRTLALYMGVAQYAELGDALMASGYDRGTPVAVVENGTTDEQRVVRTVLGSLARAQAALSIEPPALLIVGDTASFAERYSWFAPSRVETFETERTQDRARVSY